MREWAVLRVPGDNPGVPMDAVRNFRIGLGVANQPDGRFHPDPRGCWSHWSIGLGLPLEGAAGELQVTTVMHGAPTRALFSYFRDGIV